MEYKPLTELTGLNKDLWLDEHESIKYPKQLTTLSRTLRNMMMVSYTKVDLARSTIFSLTLMSIARYLNRKSK